MYAVLSETDLTGKIFGYWTVVRRAGSSKEGRKMWLCRCKCGTERAVRGYNLRNGTSKSCGCLSAEMTRERSVTHGMTQTRLYKIWNQMIQRTTNEKAQHYNRYGGRGISVCEEWKRSFEAFKEWALKNGYADNLTIDRADNEKGYCPDNCRWVTRAVQQENTSRTHFLTYKGETKSITEWAKATGIKRSVLYDRINKMGWDIERALTTK